MIKFKTSQELEREKNGWLSKCKWMIADAAATQPRQWAWYNCQEDEGHFMSPHRAAHSLGKQTVFLGTWFLPDLFAPLSTIQTCSAFVIVPRWSAYDFTKINQGMKQEDVIVQLIRNGNRVQWYGIEIYLLDDKLSTSKEKPAIPIFGGIFQ